MPAWLQSICIAFRSQRTFTREDRQEVTLRYAIWFSIVVLMSLLPFRIIEWERVTETIPTPSIWSTI